MSFPLLRRGAPWVLLPTLGCLAPTVMAQAAAAAAMPLVPEAAASAPADTPAAAEAVPATALPATAAPAQAALPEVIVTSERRSQNLQKLAVSVTALNGQVLQQKGKTDIADILQEVPGVVFQNVKPNGVPLLSVRGVGTDNPLGNAGVAMYVDGFGIKQGALQFHDLERVEVLRGPQGTLYGRGAPAGAVNFITRDPEYKFGAGLQTELGSYSLLRNAGYVNVPLSDTVAARLSFSAIRRSGWYDNGLSDDDQRNVRLKVKVKPNEQLSWVVSAETYRNNSKGEGQVTLDANQEIPGYISNAPSVEGLGLHDSFNKFTSTLNYDFGGAALTYLASKSNYLQDSATYLGGNSNHAVGREDSARTHEVRLASTQRTGIKWVAGFYAADSHLDSTTTITNAMFTGDFGNVNTQSSRALFAEATVPLMESLRVNVGGRYSHDRYQYDFPQTFTFLIPAPPEGFPDLNFAHVVTDGSNHHLDYKLRLEHDLNRASMVYAGVASGYRPGGAAGTGSGGVQPYTPETNRALELGSKNRLFGGRLQLNGAVYQYNYSGFQQPYQPAGSPFVTILSSPAKFRGGEIEGRARLSDVDALSLNYAYLQSRYTNSALPVPHSPRNTLGLGYDRAFFLQDGASVRFGVDAKYQSSQYTNYAETIDPGMYQKGYTITDLNLRYETADGRYSVSGYVKNVTNTLYKLSVNQVQGGADTATISAPRTFGIVFGVRM